MIRRDCQPSAANAATCPALLPVKSQSRPSVSLRNATEESPPRNPITPAQKSVVCSSLWCANSDTQIRTLRSGNSQRAAVGAGEASMW